MIFTIVDTLCANHVTFSIGHSALSMSSFHKKFTEEEDRLLTALVDEYGAKTWINIARRMPNRTGRQCRDRYQNYLAPTIIHGSWTRQEEATLAEKYHELGPKWTSIKQFLPGRTGSAIKNYWQCHLVKVATATSVKANGPLEPNGSVGGCTAIDRVFQAECEVANERDGFVLDNTDPDGFVWIF